jgi:hypothetical protein
MAKRRFKIEFEDGEGGKYNMSIDGKLSNEKIIKIMDMIDLLSDQHEKIEQLNFANDTMFGKIYNLISDKFAFGFFTSNDVLEAYEDGYNSPIRLSTISTYLQRLTNKGILLRNRNSIGWIYRKAQPKLEC